MLRNINRQRSSACDGIMIALTNSAEPIAIVSPITLLLAGYAKHDKHMIAGGWQTAAGLAITGVVSTGLKYAVNRQRPYKTDPNLQYYRAEQTASFPSGHTAFSFCTATSLSICYPRWYIMAPAYLWAASVGYSRMYLGEHYSTDVLAGAVVGTGSAWLAYKGNQWLQKRRDAKAHLHDLPL